MNLHIGSATTLVLEDNNLQVDLSQDTITVRARLPKTRRARDTAAAVVFLLLGSAVGYRAADGGASPMAADGGVRAAAVIDRTDYPPPGINRADYPPTVVPPPAPQGADNDPFGLQGR